MAQIKICGMMRPCDIDYINEAKPDYVGFILAPGRRRTISEETLRLLSAHTAPGIQRVGVFIRQDPRWIAALLNEGVLDFAQLHGGEDEAYLAALRSHTKKPIIQAFTVRSPEDVRRVQRSTAEEILLDNGAGTGKTFDWSLLQSVTRPYFLAGGLNPENLQDAIRQCSPKAVDLSSGVETNGFKDREKIKICVRSVRNV